ncbi:HEAT repeat domain-containing protein [Dictyobacter kobayashii]|uniref:NACHT domain-containing protein n=1 Tax=Dictyobacter kobayashii TaxID=2014872 RepID=A0A402ATK1_9CHLR|nr:HEAT repeat domain-containing protein [Dictyobacter kobayashii]GCE22476.1 hypothetical protein KDK_62760 [Dictyobacter kobayashii]
MVLSSYETARERYLRALLSRYGTLTLPISSGDHDISLEAIFQPLELRSHSQTDLDKDATQSDDEEAEKRQGRSQARTIVAQNGTEALQNSPERRLIILGAPGMGKTTLLKDMLQRAIQHALHDPQAPLPLFISLPDLARNGSGLIEYLPRLLSTLQIERDFIPVLVEAVINGQAVLCLDSLDEVLPAQRPEIIAIINRSATLYSGTWIIGSRFTEYQGGQFTSGRFSEWTLLPLNYTLRLQLAERLLPLLSQLLQTPQPSVETFIHALNHDRRIAEWGNNPLLFSLAAIAYVRQGMLPAQRATLYASIINVILHLRITDTSQRQQLLLQLAHIALALYQTRGRTFTVQDLLQQVSAHEERATSQYERLAAVLNSGVLDAMGDQTYGFKHQMFQEYLAAVALAQQMMDNNPQVAQKGWDFAWRKRTYSRWREILRLLVGILVQDHGEAGSQKAALWLEKLANAHISPDGDPGHLCLLLAINSLAEFQTLKQYPQLRQTIQQLITTWATTLFQAHIDADQLNSTSDDWKPSAFTDTRQATLRLEQCLDTILAIDISLILPALLSLEQAFSQTWQQEAIDIFKNASPHNPLLFWQNSGVITIPARVLALAFPEQAPINLYTIKQSKRLTVPLAVHELLSLFQNPQERWQLRAGAATLLAKTKEPSITAVLIDTLLDSAVYYRLRMATAEVLGWQAGPEAIQALVQATRDTDERIRQAAVIALGHTGKAMPIQPLLEALCDSCDIRKAAITALKQLDVQADLTPLLGHYMTIIQL